jgi:hypothetical protein
MCQKEEDMSSYTEGQIHQLANKLEAEGFTPEDITKLGQLKNLSDIIRGLFCGTHELRLVRHIINCDADPFIPSGSKVVEHRKGGQGQLEWNMKKVSLYLSELQKDGKYIEGNKLREELKAMPVLNANVLDYLLAHPRIIPEEWKDESVNFWGTIYLSPDGHLSVRCLRWFGGQWHWDWNWLIHSFGSGGPAVVRAS